MKLVALMLVIFVGMSRQAVQVTAGPAGTRCWHRKSCDT
jgi:hypothetical protein